LKLRRKWHLRHNFFPTSVPSKKILHWAKVCCSGHAVAQTCRHTTNEAFQSVKGLCNINMILNLECCKCARMRFNCANGLVALRSFLTGNTASSLQGFCAREKCKRSFQGSASWAFAAGHFKYKNYCRAFCTSFTFVHVCTLNVTLLHTMLRIVPANVFDKNLWKKPKCEVFSAWAKTVPSDDSTTSVYGWKSRWKWRT